MDAKQLVHLRQRIERINRKYVSGPPRRIASLADKIEDLVEGEIVHTLRGAHFETERLWGHHRRHGCVDISELAALPNDLFRWLSSGEDAQADACRWAFLDTETIGLAEGAGPCAFLIGVGAIESAGFRLRQFFMRDYSDEASVLVRLAEHLNRFDVLITYNGKAFDQPLLQGRFRWAGLDDPFGRLQHMDLLFSARRLWKLRLQSCRLMDLEARVLGVERQGDLPGVMIPYCYFDYLRTQQAFRLVPIFHHNAMDILSLACLTAIVPAAFGAPEVFATRHGSDLIGLARWLLQTRRAEEALRLFRRAVDLGLPDNILFKTLWEIAVIERRLAHLPEAVDAFGQLVESRNPYQARAAKARARLLKRVNQSDEVLHSIQERPNL